MGPKIPVCAAGHEARTGDACGWGNPRPGEHARYIYPCEWREGRKFTQVRPGIVASTGCDPDPRWSQTDMQWQQELENRANMHAGGIQAGGSTTLADGLSDETFSITLPDGCTQGDRLTVALPDGRAVEIIVPQGTAPGGQVGIRVPSQSFEAISGAIQQKISKDAYTEWPAIVRMADNNMVRDPTPQANSLCYTACNTCFLVFLMCSAEHMKKMYVTHAHSVCS